MPGFKTACGARRHGASLRPGGPPCTGESMPAGAAAAKVGGAGSRLLGDEEAQAEVSAVAESNGAGDWLGEY